MPLLFRILLAAACGGAIGFVADAADHPLSARRRAALDARLDETITQMTGAIERDPSEVQNFSRRGDALFFRGRFKQALADYEKMIELEPTSEPKHWRRGIAYFYAGAYKQAARQFEIYHTYDDVDRENGIWRFLCQAKAFGLPAARKGLLKYKKDDREPFGDVYRLFAGKTEADEILRTIRAADITEQQRETRMFYAQLYIGLYADVTGKPKQAVEHLRHAVANTWAPNASYGPRYMWHVARLHYQLRTAAQMD